MFRDQWLEDGDCNKCRRKKYCTKDCKKATIRAKKELGKDIAKAMINLRRKRMKIYIAGKITGYPEFRETFQAAEDKIKKYGHTTINPSKLNDILGDDFSQEDYMKVCYSLIDISDAIFLLKNWRDSKGARLEKTFAFYKGKKVFYEDEKLRRMIEINCKNCIHMYTCSNAHENKVLPNPTNCGVDYGFALEHGEGNMKRLTRISKITDFYMPIKLQEGCGESACKEICEQYVGDYCIGCPVQECMTRLAKYENTGLTPDEIKEQIEILKHNYKCTEDTLERQYDNALKMVNKLEKDCDYWKREALKWANELGNQKIERGK